MYIRKSLSKFQQTEPFSNTSELELKLFHFLTDNYDCFKCREELLKCGECDYCNDNFPIAIEDFKPQSQSARETIHAQMESPGCREIATNSVILCVVPTTPIKHHSKPQIITQMLSYISLIKTNVKARNFSFRNNYTKIF